MTELLAFFVGVFVGIWIWSVEEQRAREIGKLRADAARRKWRDYWAARGGRG